MILLCWVGPPPLSSLRKSKTNVINIEIAQWMWNRHNFSVSFGERSCPVVGVQNFGPGVVFRYFFVEIPAQAI